MTDSHTDAGWNEPLPWRVRPPRRRDTASFVSPAARAVSARRGGELPPPGTGTGLAGRVTRDDVVALAGRPATGPPAPRGDELEPFDRLRRRIAEHMVQSKSSAAHAFVSVEADFGVVDAVRRARQADWRAVEGFPLTYLPFIARAVVDALVAFPHVNATVDDDGLVVHHRVQLGIAVDLDHGGLIVPVVRNAETLRLRGIARAIADLAARARARSLSPDDVGGGSFTITNPGPFGTALSVPVIDHPQVAILATDAVRRRPVAVELPDGRDAIGVGAVGRLGLSFDHRAIDGAYAAAFLARVRDSIETRDWRLEL